MKSPIWRHGGIFVASVLPVLFLGWFFLKSAEDSLIAERVRGDKQARHIIKLNAEKAEDSIADVNQYFFEISEGPSWYETLSKDSRIGGIRWRDTQEVILQPRSAEVSRWLLTKEEKRLELIDWLENSRFQFSPAYVLFVIQESGLSEHFSLLVDQLTWELNSDDLRGVSLANGIAILWNIEALPVVEGKYRWQKETYEVAVQGVGENVGLVAVLAPLSSENKPYKTILTFCCLSWVLGLLLFLLFYSRKKEREAHESLDQLSAVAHELRTPLTGMKLLLERIKSQYSDIPHLDQIESERQRLEGIMEQFLVQGKLQKGTLQLRAENWQNWLKNEHARYLNLTRNDLTLHLELLPQHQTNVYLDYSLMSIVVSNLLKNAEQYGDGSEVTLKEASHENSVGFEVVDAGLGMDQELQKRVFQKYERGEMSLYRNSEGLGLGLSLARDIISHHDGHIEIFSEDGKGTLVRVTLPKE
ncbi:sensor histidine kinase [Rubritalea sp.]|uniref:sensor histidine kinase n=1 Tax=Rubritalea sp. TaxID=2109375 RepID=UPI003EFAE9B5